MIGRREEKRAGEAASCNDWMKNGKSQMSETIEICVAWCVDSRDSPRLLLLWGGG